MELNIFKNKKLRFKKIISLYNEMQLSKFENISKEI